MPHWAVNQVKTLIVIQVFPELLHHLRGGILNQLSYPFESYVTGTLFLREGVPLLPNHFLIAVQAHFKSTDSS
jgi:hypothetical protein